MPGPIGVALVITIVFLIILVRLAGLEPARPEGPRGLNPRRLPFRHNRKMVLGERVERSQRLYKNRVLAVRRTENRKLV
jgi:hypothetical protein